MNAASLPKPSTTPRRLDFRLPDFTRYAWVSDGARGCWEPRIRRVSEMLLELEWRMIAEVLRPCALRSVPADGMDALRASLAPHGIEVEPLQPIRLGASYSASLEPPAGGPPPAFWSALGRRPDLDRLCAAYHQGDQETVGRLLGYPPCCIAFFQEVWVRQALVDTTWPMAVGTAGHRVVSGRHVEIPEPSRCGMQLRWLGVRQVFHLPCSFDCEGSREVADRVGTLAARLGYDRELGWLEEMLLWPAEWSALHGIAEVKTPVVKVVTRTDATPEKYVVTYRGDRRTYPDHGAVGLAFPFRVPVARQVTSSRTFKVGLDNAILPVIESAETAPTPRYHQDNGFSSRYAMDRSHRPIVDRVRDLLQVAPPPARQRLRVLDLGCGNGALVRKIAELHPGVVPAGVDLSPEKIAYARRLLPRFGDEFRVANLFDVAALGDGSGENFLTILMLGRLIEIGSEAAREFLEWLRGGTRHLLVYAYDDYVLQAGPLHAMAAQVGVELLDPEAERNVSLARVGSSAGLPGPDEVRA